MTSPSPGQIARYLKNHHYKTDEEYLFALADVMRREYQAIVEAGFILQLDCPDLAMLRHSSTPTSAIADYRKIIAVNVEALNHAVQATCRPTACACMCAGARRSAPHHTDVPLKDIVDIVLTGRPHGGVVPGANPRHGTSGRSGRTSSCRTARSSFRA